MIFRFAEDCCKPTASQPSTLVTDCLATCLRAFCDLNERADLVFEKLRLAAENEPPSARFAGEALPTPKVCCRSPIYLPSENADSIYLVGSGLVKICHLTVDGKISTLAYVKTWRSFWRAGSFRCSRARRVRRVGRSMRTDSHSQTAHTELMNRDLDVALAVTKLVGLRRQRIERRLTTLLFTSNQHRLNHLLLDLAEQFGVAIEGGIRLGLKLSHQEIANLIGTTRETVTILMAS